ncbi:MAG: hypothetical protein ACR5LC_04895 [Symbiopectobacterium sp.]|uniref:hypothetical protein n=1 Tax=Symbiopectobacterium sp. TaxID=2952789 RepID=UPI003F3989D2
MAPAIFPEWSYDGGELMLQTPETSSLLVLSIPLALLSDITDELPHRVYAIHHDLLANRLREYILAMLHSVMEHPLQFAQRQARLQFLNDIRELAFAFFTAVGTQTISVRPSLQKAQRVVTKA